MDILARAFFGFIFSCFDLHGKCKSRWNLIAELKGVVRRTVGCDNQILSRGVTPGFKPFFVLSEICSVFFFPLFFY